MDFEYDRDKLNLNMYPNESRLIAVSIEWKWWNCPDTPWHRRGVGIWVHALEADSRKVYEK